MNKKWILIFYALPSKPISVRMKFWRRLQKEGALALKESVYILPFSEERYEFCQWLAKEISSVNGQLNFVVSDKIETLQNDEIIKLFNTQTETLYAAVSLALDKLNGEKDDKKRFSTISKLTKEYNEVKKNDFFDSAVGLRLQAKINALAEQPVLVEKIKPQELKNFQNRVWVTRKRPFIDRIASAWLICRFIDKKAKFAFVDDGEDIDGDAVAFDMNEADFTHIGAMCTFEVLVESFAVKDEDVFKIAKIVHLLDVKDDLYESLEAYGILAVLKGLRNVENDDSKLLERGMEIFELLYMGEIN